MTKSSYTVTGCCWRLLHWDQSRSGRRNHNANRCRNILYLSFVLVCSQIFKAIISDFVIPGKGESLITAYNRWRGWADEKVRIQSVFLFQSLMSIIPHLIFCKLSTFVILVLQSLTKIRLKRFVATTASTWRWPTGGRRWRQRWPRWSVRR